MTVVRKVVVINMTIEVMWGAVVRLVNTKQVARG